MNILDNYILELDVSTDEKREQIEQMVQYLIDEKARKRNLTSNVEFLAKNGKMCDEIFLATAGNIKERKKVINYVNCVEYKTTKNSVDVNYDKEEIFKTKEGYTYE